VSAEKTTSGAVGFMRGPWTLDRTFGSGFIYAYGAMNERTMVGSVCLERDDRTENADSSITIRKRKLPHGEANATLMITAPDLYEALSDLVEIIECAGISNLANGVQLGQTSWAIKAGDRMRWAKTCLAKATGTLLNTTDSAASSPDADQQAP